MSVVILLPSNTNHHALRRPLREGTISSAPPSDPVPTFSSLLASTMNRSYSRAIFILNSELVAMRAGAVPCSMKRKPTAKAALHCRQGHRNSSNRTIAKQAPGQIAQNEAPPRSGPFHFAKCEIRSSRILRIAGGIARRSVSSRTFRGSARTQFTQGRVD